MASRYDKIISRMGSSSFQAWSKQMAQKGYFQTDEELRLLIEKGELIPGKDYPTKTYTEVHPVEEDVLFVQITLKNHDPDSQSFECVLRDKYGRPRSIRATKSALESIAIQLGEILN